MMRLIGTAALAAILLLSSPSAMSAGFKIKPLKIFFTPDTKTANLTVTNEGDGPVSVQLTVRSWNQGATGEDIYDTTSDIVFFPKIVQIAPAEERVIRIGYAGEPAGSVEKSYRLYAQELPVQEPGEFAMKFVVRMGIPVFVRSSYQETSWEVGAAEMDSNGLKIPVLNKSGQHIRVENLMVSGVDAQGAEVFSSANAGWYVLAEHTREFVLHVDKSLCSTAKTLNFSATVDETTRNRQIDLDPVACDRLEVPKQDLSAR